jgi:hypothetical protein
MGLLRKALLLIALSFAFIPGEAFAVCTGQFLGGTLCGNNTSAQGIPNPTANPVLGVPGTNTGSVGFAGSASGTATVSAQSAAGTPALLLPTVSGTFPSTASLPVVLNAVTGVLTCPTCVTSSGGGAITGVSPINVSAAGAVSLQGATGSIVVGSGGTGSSFTPTPVLGVAGSTVGSLGFQNATSGTETITPATGALGSGVATLPAGTYNIVGDSLTQTLTSKTYSSGTLSGTFSGNATFSGNETFSGNNTFSGQLIETGTTFPSQAAGQTVVLGTIASPSLTTNGQAVLYNTSTAGLVLQGVGSVQDFTLLNKSAGGVCFVATGTTTLSCTAETVGGAALGSNALAVSGAVFVNGAGGSISSGGADNNFSAGGNRAFMDFATTNARIGSVAGGGSAVGLQIVANGSVVQSFASGGTSTFTVPVVVQSNSANAFDVGANGATNPALQVDASTASSATGILVKSAASGANAQISGISTATNEGLTINAKGSGQIALANTSTGNVTIGLGGGGLVVSNLFTATGLVTYADLATAALATQSQYFSAAANTIVPTNIIYTAEQTTTFGATTTFDFSTFINTAVTLTANITTQTLSNVKAGQAGQIRFIQDGSGSHTTVWNSIFKFSGGTTPTLSTAANAIDVLFYSCVSTSLCYASLTLNMK